MFKEFEIELLQYKNYLCSYASLEIIQYMKEKEIEIFWDIIVRNAKMSPRFIRDNADKIHFNVDWEIQIKSRFLITSILSVNMFRKYINKSTKYVTILSK